MKTKKKRFNFESVLSGLSNLEECPLNRNIPVFVLVGGAIAFLKLFQVLWRHYNRRHEPAEEEASDTNNGSVEYPKQVVSFCFPFN